MTTLYIANTSKQDHDFTFRQAERLHPTTIKIPAGTQAPVVKNGDSELVDSIIAHHRPYGLLHAKEAAKSKRFVGMCYDVDRPVTFKDMKVVFEHNDHALEEQGREQVAGIAAAVNDGIDKHLEVAGIPTDAAHVSIEVREERGPGEQPTLAVGAEVVKSPEQAEQSQRRRGGGRNR